MGVPKRKVAHARQMDRRSHHALTLPRLEPCPHCHQPKLPHRACPECGWYKGRQVYEPKPAGGRGAEEAGA
jgi:large subunit ribosomal protein L32